MSAEVERLKQKIEEKNHQLNLLTAAIRKALDEQYNPVLIEALEQVEQPYKQQSSRQQALKRLITGLFRYEDINILLELMVDLNYHWSKIEEARLQPKMRAIYAQKILSRADVF